MNRGYDHIAGDELLFLLGEELKQPLISISQLAELQDNGSAVGIHAKKALQTIDTILLYRRIHSGQEALKLEPVHVGSTVQEVNSALAPIMRAAGCRTDIQIQKSLSPVDVDRRVLRGALQCMWQALLSTISTPSDIVCRVQKTKNGIRLSLTSEDANMGGVNLNKINIKSSQPITSLAGPATDLLASQGMFELLGAQLGKAGGRNISGFGVTLKPSKQLQII